MALLFVDSFDHYATADIATKWTSTYVAGFGGAALTIGSGNGRRSTNAAHLINGNANLGGAGAYIKKTVAPTGSTFIAGAAFKFGPTAPTAVFRPNLIALYSGATLHGYLRLNTDMTLSYLNWSNVVLGTTSFTATQNAFTHVELKVLLHASAGTIDVRINNTPALTLTGQATANGTTSWNNVNFGLTSSDSNIFTSDAFTLDIDDVYIADGSGSRNNDFLGDCAIECKIVNTGNGANAGWVPSTGTDHGALVHDSAPDGDSTYISSSTVGAKDTFTISALTATTGTIKAVQTNLYAKKSDAGTRAINDVIRIGGTDYDGSAQNPSTAYQFISQVHETSPATSTNFTISEVNGAEFGVKVNS